MIDNEEINPLTGLPYSSKTTFTPKPKRLNAIDDVLYQKKLASEYVSPYDITESKQVPGFEVGDYNKYVSDINYEDKGIEGLREERAQNQGILEQAGSSLVKLVAKTGLNVVGGIGGTIYGAGSALANWDSSKFFDNDVMTGLDNASKALDESVFPVYKTRDYQNNFVLKNVLFHPAQFFDELTDALAFSTGAIVSGMLTGGAADAMLSAKAMQFLNMTSKAGKFTGAVENAGKLSLNKIIGATGKFGAQMLTGANYESAIEANGAKKQWIDKWYQSYIKDNGIEPTDIEYEKANEIADDMSKNVYLGNLALLSIGNAIQFPKALGLKFGSSKAAKTLGVADELNVEKGLIEGSGDVFAMAKTKATLGEKVWKVSKNMLVEGNEEGTQSVMSSSGQDYASRKYNKVNVDETASFIESMGTGFAQTYGTIEGWNQVVMGMMIGGIGGPGGKVFGQKNANWIEGGVYGGLRDLKNKYKEAGEVLIDANATPFSVRTKEAVSSLIADKQADNNWEKNVLNGNKFDALTAKDDMLLGHVNAMDKANLRDQLQLNIENLNSMDIEEFKTNFVPSDQQNSFTERDKLVMVEGIKNRVQSILKAKDMVDAAIPSDLKTPQHIKDAKDDMIHLLSSANLVDIREDELSKKLDDNGFNGSQSTKVTKGIAEDLRENQSEIIAQQDAINLLKDTKEIKQQKNTKLIDESNKKILTNSELISKLQQGIENNNKKIDELNKEIDSLEKEEDLTKKESSTKRLRSGIEAEESMLKSNQEKLDTYTKENNSLQGEITTLNKEVSDMDTEIEKQVKGINSLLASKYYNSDLKYKYDNFTEYQQAVNQHLEELDSLTKNLKTKFDTVKQKEITALLKDLGKLAYRRVAAINAYNKLLSPAEFAKKAEQHEREQKNILEYILDKDATKKALTEVEANAKNISSKTALTKDGKVITNYSAEQEDGGLVYNFDKPIEVDGKMVNSLTEEAFFDLISDKAYNTRPLTPEELETESEEAKLLKNTRTENGELLVKGKLVTFTVAGETTEDAPHGELIEPSKIEFFAVSNTDGTFIKHHTVDENGKISPYWLSTTAIKELTDKHGEPVISEEEEKTYSGDVITYGTDQLLALEHQEDPSIINAKAFDNKVEAKEKFFTKAFSIIRGKKVYQNFAGKISKYKFKRNGKWWTKVGKPFAVKDSGEQFEYRIISNAKEGYYIQDGKVFSMDHTEQENPLQYLSYIWSAPKGKIAIGNDIEFIGNISYPSGKQRAFGIIDTKDGKKIIAIDFITSYWKISNDALTLMKSKPDNINKEPEDKDSEIEITGENEDGKVSQDNDRILQTGQAKILTLNNSAGANVKTIYNKLTDKYYAVYDDDGKQVINIDNGQKEWFEFTNKSTKETIKEQGVKFIPIINSSSARNKVSEFLTQDELDEMFPLDQEHGEDEEGVIDIINADNTNIRILAVTIKDGIPVPIRENGKLVYTSLHTPMYKGLGITDEKLKKQIQDQWSAVRKETIKLIDSETSTYEFDNDKAISIPVFEGNPSNGHLKYKEPINGSRVRSDVRGTLIDKNGDVNKLHIVVSKSDPSGKPILRMSGNDRGTQNTGEVWTEKVFPNGKRIPVKLLSRTLNEEEASTIINALKEHGKQVEKGVSPNETQIDGIKILPFTEGSARINSIISQFIRFGFSKNKSTQIGFSKRNSKELIYDKNGKLNIVNATEDEWNELKGWLLESKIHHVSVDLLQPKGDTKFILIHVNNDGTTDKGETFNSYKEYLFNTKNPVLSTDLQVIDESDPYSQLAQVNLDLTSKEVYSEETSKETKESLINATKKKVVKNVFTKVKGEEYDENADYGTLDIAIDDKRAAEREKWKGYSLNIVTGEMEKDSVTNSTDNEIEGTGLEGLIAKSIEKAEDNIQNNEAKNEPLAREANEYNAGKVYVQEHIEQAKTWFKKRFPNIPLDADFDGLVHGRLFGEYVDGAVKLSKIAIEGTIFHEAFHVVSDLFLTTKQRIALYNELRKKDGKEYTDKEAEEILAEEYREYALTGKTRFKDSELKKRTLFQGIKAFINKISEWFGLHYNPTIKDVFDKINQNAEYAENKITEIDENVIPGLSAYDTQQVMGNIFLQVTTPLWTKYKGDLEEYTKHFGEELTGLLTRLQKDPINQKHKYYSKVFANVGKFSSLLQDYLKPLGLEFDITNEDNKILTEEELENIGLDEDTNTMDKDSAAWIDKMYFSNLKSVDNKIKFLIASLPVMDKNNPTEVYIEKDSEGNVVNGMYQVHPMNEVYNKVLEITQGTYNYDDMIPKIQEAAKDNPELNRVISRINMTNGKVKLDYITGFRQAFGIPKYGHKSAIIDGTEIYMIDSDSNRVTEQVKKKWNTDFMESSAYAQNHNNQKLYNEKILGTKDTKGLLDKYPSVVNNDLQMQQLVNFLNEFSAYFGINFSPKLFTKSGDKYVKGNDIKRLGEAISWFINDTATNNIRIDALTDLKYGRLNEAALLNSVQEGLVNESQFINPEGKTVYKFSQNNLYTIVLNELKAISKLSSSKLREQAIRERLPQLAGAIQYSSWLKKIINKDNTFNGENIEYTILDGVLVNQSGTDGVVGSDLSPTDLINMHFTALFGLKGTQKTIPSFLIKVPSDKSLAPSISGFDLVETVRELFHIDKNGLASGEMVELLVYEVNNKNLVIFKSITEGGILNDKSYNAIKNLDKFNREDKLEILELIQKDVLHFISNEVEKNKQLLIDNKLINEDGSNIGLSPGVVKNYGVKNLIERFTYNHILGSIEQMYLFSGTYDNYANFYKRTSGIVGTGETMSIDIDVNAFIKDSYEKLLASSNKTDRYDLVKKLDNINNISFSVMKDIYESASSEFIEEMSAKLKEQGYSESDINKYLEPYLVIEGVSKGSNIADGIAYIDIDLYRETILRSNSSMWTNKHEDAYNRMNQGLGTINDAVYFPSLKPQLFGPEDGSNNNPLFFKCSVMPLLPLKEFKGTVMMDMLEDMHKSGSKLMLMESAVKNGKYTINEYNEGQSNDLKTHDVSIKYWKIQVKQHFKVKEHIQDGSQQRNLIFQDIFNQGVLIDFKDGKSELKDLYDEYNKVYDALVISERDKLLSEMAISLDSNGEYKVNDYNKFAAMLKKEIKDGNKPNNYSDGIVVNNNTGKLLLPIDTLPVGEKIEQILMSRVNNNLVKLKRPGSGYVQTSNHLFRAGKGSNELMKYAKKLKFLTLENGKIRAAQVYLPHYFKEMYGRDVKFEDIDPRLLNVMGYRIPTQGTNALLPIEIAGFLPQSMGDVIVVPYEIVTQSGSDFDIDKLNILRPNYEILKGQIFYTESNKNTKESLQNRLLEIQLQVLSNPLLLKNLITPNSASFLKDEALFVNFLKDSSTSLGMITPHNTEDVKTKFEAWKKRNSKKKSNVSEILSYSHEVETGLAYRAGKQGVAVWANIIKFISTGQQSNLQTIEQRIKAPLPKGPQGYNHMYDSAGNLISEVASQALTANVDVASDNFISRLNANMMTANVRGHLYAKGVDRQWVNRFLNQPIIEEFVRRRVMNESLTLETKQYEKNNPVETKAETLQYLLEQYGVKPQNATNYLNEIHLKEDTVYTINELNQFIYDAAHQEEELIPNGDSQIEILADFLAYVEQAKIFGDAIQALKFDTNGGGKNLEDSRKAIDNYNAVVDSEVFINFEDTTKNTIMGIFKSNSAELSIEIYAEQFLTQLSTVRDKIFNVIKKDLVKGNMKLSSDNKELNLLKQSLLTYLLQTAISNTKSGFTKEQFEKLLMSKESLAHSVYMKRKSKRMKDNLVMKNFINSELNKNNTGINNVTVVSQKMDTFTHNLYTSAFNEIAEKDPVLASELLVALSMQSGYLNSPISYMKQFPTKMIADTFGPTLDKIMREPNLINEYEIKQFLKNFYAINSLNKKLVPNAKGKGTVKIIGDILTIDGSHNLAGKQSVKTWHTQDGEHMMKQWWLEKSIANEDKTLKITYYSQMNPKGNGGFMQEYTPENTSVVEKENVEYIDSDSIDTASNDITKVAGKEYIDNTLESEEKVISSQFNDIMSSGRKVSEIISEEKWSSIDEKTKVKFKECN